MKSLKHCKKGYLALLFLSFIEDVCKFLGWTEIKFDYRYFGSNKRVVKRGEIYYCELGENVGSEQSEYRPVIILQNDVGNQFGPTTIVAPITNTHKKLPVHVALDKGLKTTGRVSLVRWFPRFLYSELRTYRSPPEGTLRSGAEFLSSNGARLRLSGHGTG